MIGTCLLAAALCSGPWSPKLPPWPDVDRRSPRLVAKMEAKRRARHEAAQASRKDFDEAMRILKSPPQPICPCITAIPHGFE